MSRYGALSGSVKVRGAGNVIDILTTAGTAKLTQETLRKLWTAFFFFFSSFFNIINL
jgi:hypothetical protein